MAPSDVEVLFRRLVDSSSGARIDWETGTENLDACAEVLKEIIAHSKRGGMIMFREWTCSLCTILLNAEATMMSHCTKT